jgi:hypothetical protein
MSTPVATEEREQYKLRFVAMLITARHGIEDALASFAHGSSSGILPEGTAAELLRLHNDLTRLVETLEDTQVPIDEQGQKNTLS